MDWDYHTIQLGAQQGWQCPVCGSVNAPWVAQCPCGGKVKSYTTTTTTDGTGKTLEYKIDYGRPTTTTIDGTGKILKYKIDYNRPPYTQVTSTGDQTIYTNNPMTTATSPKYTTTTATSSQPEENCENCLGGCDLCYYCENGDHYTYKGLTTTKK